jgi:hypothetical protein
MSRKKPNEIAITTAKEKFATNDSPRQAEMNANRVSSER